MPRLDSNIFFIFAYNIWIFIVNIIMLRTLTNRLATAHPFGMDESRVCFILFLAVSFSCREKLSAWGLQLSLSFAISVYTVSCCSTMSSLQRRFGFSTYPTPFTWHFVLLIVHVLSFIWEMCPARLDARITENQICLTDHTDLCHD